MSLEISHEIKQKQKKNVFDNYENSSKKKRNIFNAEEIFF